MVTQEPVYVSLSLKGSASLKGSRYMEVPVSLQRCSQSFIRLAAGTMANARQLCQYALASYDESDDLGSHGD